LINLIFIKSSNIQITFAQLKILANKLNCENIKKILIFMKKVLSVLKKRAVFQQDFWNYYNRTLNNDPRSINSLKAWHRGLNFKCNIPHLNLGKYFEVLIEETEKVGITLNQQMVYLATSANLKKENNWLFYCRITNFMVCLSI
jgi:hypothetical protein